MSTKKDMRRPDLSKCAARSHKALLELIVL
jgi:hypothetical protein